MIVKNLSLCFQRIADLTGWEAEYRESDFINSDVTRYMLYILFLPKISAQCVVVLKQSAVYITWTLFQRTQCVFCDTFMRSVSSQWRPHLHLQRKWCRSSYSRLRKRKDTGRAAPAGPSVEGSEGSSRYSAIFPRIRHATQLQVPATHRASPTGGRTRRCRQDPECVSTPFASHAAHLRATNRPGPEAVGARVRSHLNAQTG